MTTPRYKNRLGSAQVCRPEMSVGANPTENGSVMEMEDIVIRKITASQHAGSSPARAIFTISYTELHVNGS